MNRKTILTLLIITISISALSAAGKEKETWKEMDAKAGEIKIHYLEAGAGDRVLVFIPGWMTNAQIWKEQIPYFAGRGFRVIAMDPRNQGSSAKTETGNTFKQHAADLKAFLKELKIEHSYLVGWGTGVTTLLEYLSDSEILKPEKVVFIDGWPAAPKLDDYPGMITTQQARKLILSFQEDRKKAAEDYARSLFKTRPAEWIVTELIESILKTPAAAALSLFFDQFTGDRRQALAHVTVPSLIIATAENRAVGEYMKANIRRANLEVIEGVGTAMFLEKPQKFNQTIEDFLGAH
jgi:pimeloyl-ACP methyl ester carboxylesterase